jgi:hypothetical protein
MCVDRRSRLGFLTRFNVLGFCIDQGGRRKTMMIGRRWVHHANLWTALSRVSTGFVASSPVGCHNSFFHSRSSALKTNHYHAGHHHHFLTILGSIKMGFATSNANAITASSSSSFSSTDESSSDTAPGIRKERRSWRKKWRRDVGFSLSLVLHIAHPSCARPLRHCVDTYAKRRLTRNSERF